MIIFRLGYIQSAFRDAKLALGEYEARMLTNRYSVTSMNTVIYYVRSGQ